MGVVSRLLRYPPVRIGLHFLFLGVAVGSPEAADKGTNIMLTGDMPCASESKGGHQQSIPGILWHPSDAPPAHNTMAE